MKVVALRHAIHVN